MKPNIPPSSALLRVGCTAVLLVATACKSTATYRGDADRAAYELVQSRRTKLGLDTGAFTIEPDPNSLRQRLLRGETPLDHPLGLVECLQIAAENSRDFQTQKETLYVSALNVTLERWRLALQEGGTLDALVTGDGDGASTASQTSSFSLTKLLGSGALVMGNIGLNLTRNLLHGDSWNPISDIGLSVTQPLLSGFGAKIVEEPLTQAERNLVYAARGFERFRRSFALNTTTRFYRVLQQFDTVKNQENDYENLKKLSERNRELAKAGRLSDIDLGQAVQNELRSKNDLLDARSGLALQLDNFKLFLGLPIQFELSLDGTVLADLRTQKDEELTIEEGRATEFALANRLDYLTTVDQETDSERRVAIAEDALRAVLTATATADLPSQPGKPGKFNVEDLTWNAGLTLNLPFERLPQRNSYRIAVINREVAARSTAQAEDTLRVGLRSDLRQASTRRDGYAIQLKAVDLAAQRIESTSMLMEAGRADTRSLLEAQASLLSAQNSATSALIDYTLARLGLFLDMELLRFDERGIHGEPSLLQTWSGPGEKGGRAAQADGDAPRAEANG